MIPSRSEPQGDTVIPLETIKSPADLPEVAFVHRASSDLQGRKQWASLITGISEIHGWVLVKSM